MWPQQREDGQYKTLSLRGNRHINEGFGFIRCCFFFPKSFPSHCSKRATISYSGEAQSLLIGFTGLDLSSLRHSPEMVSFKLIVNLVFFWCECARPVRPLVQVCCVVSGPLWPKWFLSCWWYLYPALGLPVMLAPVPLCTQLLRGQWSVIFPEVQCMYVIWSPCSVLGDRDNLHAFAIMFWEIFSLKHCLVHHFCLKQERKNDFS